MPRQLPWASKASSSRTQVKRPSRPTEPAGKSNIGSDKDEDFFNGTILASSRKGKERALVSDDDFSDLAAESSTPQTNLLGRGAARQIRAPSSSPPIVDVEEVQIEPMRKGVSKFDLRDDEWMMVEDEFLETAKLFTRHLHIAEYEQLKDMIEAKKKDAEIARPVVPNTKLSIDGSIKQKAKLQEQRQKQALREVFLKQAQAKNDLANTAATSSRPRRLSPTSSDSDSEDLDSLKPIPKKPLPRLPGPYPPSDQRNATPSQIHPSKPSQTPIQPPRQPHNHTPQSNPKTRSRPPRPTPFDLLDNYMPNRVPHPAQNPPTTPHPSSTRKPPPSTPPTNAWRAHNPQSRTGEEDSNTASTRTVNKRRAERDEGHGEGEEPQGHGLKRKAVHLDDIPTFLF